MALFRVLDSYGRVMDAATIAGLLAVGLAAIAGAVWGYLQILPLTWSIGLALATVLVLALSVDRVVFAVLEARGYKSPGTLEMEADNAAVAAELARLDSEGAADAAPHQAAEGELRAASTPVTVEPPTEADEIRQVRRQAGWLCERLGDYGSSLDGGEDTKAREYLAYLRTAAGNLAHHQQLRQALRDFVVAAGWMLRYKSHETDGGLQLFSSTEESSEARRDLEKSYRVLAAQCEEILDQEEGRQTIAVEVEEAALNIAIILGARSSPDPAGRQLSVLDAYLGGIKILNHTARQTHIDKVWLEIPGAKALPEFAPNTHRLEGDRQIAVGSIGRFRLSQKSVYEGEIATEDICGFLQLRVAATGCLKPLSYTLPDHCFEPNQYS